MEFHLGEKSSMFHKMLEKDDQQDVDDTRKVHVHEADGQASNLEMGVRGHGGDPIQDIPCGEDHGIDSMALKNVPGKAHAAKGHWTPEEDETLLRCKEQHSNRAWSDIALELPGRTGKQCRERWINHLDPEIKKEPWTEAEELKLVECHEELGKKWAEIAKRFKNQWYATERNVEAKLKNKREDTHPGVLEKYIRGLKEGEGTQSVLTGPIHATGNGHKVTVPIACSSFASLSQEPALGGNPFSLQPSFRGLNGDNSFPMKATYGDSSTLIPAEENDYLNGENDFPMEATYEDSLTFIPAQDQESGYLNGSNDFPIEATYEDTLTFIPAQESGYLNVDDDFALEATYKESLIPAPESGYLSSPYSIKPQQLPYYPISAQQEKAFFNYHAAEEDPIGQVFAGRCYHHDEPSYYDNSGGGNPTGGSSEAAANNGQAMPPARANGGPSSLNPPPAPGGYF